MYIQNAYIILSVYMLY